MQKISAPGTGFYKRVFPLIWFGFPAAFLLSGVLTGEARKSALVLIVPVFLGILGYVLMRHVVFDLADEVFDAGDRLIVKNAGREIEIPIAGIADVSSALRQNPPRVTLHLIEASPFGTRISFMVAKDATWELFSVTCAVADDLTRRVDAHRRKSAPG